jgi:hypothetical protein
MQTESNLSRSQNVLPILVIPENLSKAVPCEQRNFAVTALDRFEDPSNPVIPVEAISHSR